MVVIVVKQVLRSLCVYMLLLVGRLKFEGIDTATRPLYFVKHRDTRIVAAIFEGAPTKVTQHRRNAVIEGITIWVRNGLSLFRLIVIPLKLGIVKQPRFRK